MEWSRAERAEGGTNMRLQKYRYPLSKDQSEREVRVNNGEPSSNVASALSTKGLEVEEDLMW